ncbi:MAG: hypothetical protein IPK64_04560 [bacterium]|nr:hypothetical protein [bacterium]
MAAIRDFRYLVVGVALAAGLGTAVYVAADDPGKVRAKEVPVRVAFTKATTGAPVAYYQAEIRNISRDEDDVISPLEFTTAAGPVDSHVVWLTLNEYYMYVVRVRGVAGNGAVGPWSIWSDPWRDDPEDPGAPVE